LARAQNRSKIVKAVETTLAGLKTGLANFSRKVDKNNKYRNKARPSFEDLLTKYKNKEAN